LSFYLIFFGDLLDVPRLVHRVPSILSCYQIGEMGEDEEWLGEEID
jgi:hypothetical protein